MRRTRLASVVILAVATIAGWGPWAPRADGGEGPADGPLAAAERVEAEGRALLERGEKVAAAKHMIEAWSLRARAWAEEGRRAEAARLEALRAKSAAAEKEAHALRAEGKTAEADTRIQQAAALWKEAEALEARLREGGEPRPRKPEGEALAQRREVEAKVRALEAEAADLWAAGKMEAAEERLAKAKTLRAALDGKPGPKPSDDARPAPKAKGPDDAKRGLEGEVVAELKRLRRQVDELKAAVEELRRRGPTPDPTPVPTPVPTK